MLVAFDFVVDLLVILIVVGGVLVSVAVWIIIVCVNCVW